LKPGRPGHRADADGADPQLLAYPQLLADPQGAVAVPEPVGERSAPPPRCDISRSSALVPAPRPADGMDGPAPVLRL